MPSSLLSAISSLPSTSYHHPIATVPSGSTKLNPYLPIPQASGSTTVLFTNPTFLPSIPSASLKRTVVQVIDAEEVTTPRASKSLSLISRSAQEAYDHSLLALRLAQDEDALVYHFIASGLGGSVQEVEDAQSWLSGDLGSPNPANGHANGETEAADELLSAYEAICLSLLKLTRRAQRSFVHRKAESSRLIVNFLPTTLEADNVIDVVLAIPAPKEKLRSSLTGVQEVIVVEGGNGKYGSGWASVVDALEGADVNIKSVLVTGNVPASELTSAIQTSAPITRLGKTATYSIPSSSVAIPSPESSYTSLLESSPTPLEILNDPSHLAANESTSPLYAFGKAVALRKERARLIELAKKILKASNTRKDVHEALSAWLLVRDEQGAANAGEKVAEVVGAGASPDEKELAQLGANGHWEKKSLWIVISNSWAVDLASSGLHHALASGLDINLLVYETAPSPFSPNAPAQPPKERKKDLALYAMNMGDVYVASVAIYADYAGVINAMREAENYSGPGLVLAYLPWGDKEDGESVSAQEKAGALERLRETKRAVSGGWWPMFRWNPSLADEKRFILDSSHIKAALSEFLDRESHLSQLTLSQPAIDPSITSSVGTELVAARKEKARKAYDALLNSLDGPGLLVLYASDGGNAEKVAKRLVGRAKMRGVGASLRVLDEIAPSIVDSLAEEKNVLILTSTAGQGEAPQNGREFYKALSKTAASDKLAETKVTVFGMGDSHYWPRPEDAGYYNKPAKDIFPKVIGLGCAELCPLGLGDDSDPDGYMTGYKPFEASLWRALGVDSVEVVEEKEETVANEHIKIASDYLRGTILEGLEDKSTGAIGASDAQLTKFHGTYMQDDRDIRESLKAQGLEPAYSFMIRVRMPAGVCTADQWLHMDRISDEHGNGTFKLTTRQTFQFHGIIKSHLKPAMQAINRGLLDTIAACGDVNRNVQCCVNPAYSKTHKAVYDFSVAVSEHLLPSTNAYHEIWLDKKKVYGDAAQDFSADHEPLYGPYYLPRKFKIAVAVPPDNAVDVFTNDVGFIAIVQNDEVIGYNVSVGGGMGVTHGNKKTYPRLGDVLGFLSPEDGCKVAESIMLVQRDYGNRADRKNARLKYTVDRLGVAKFKELVEERWGKKFAEARPYQFTSNLDKYGWHHGHDGKWHFTMFIENGRIEDSPRHQFKSGLQEIAKHHKGTFRLTANQHLILSDVATEDLEDMKRLLNKWGLDNIDHSGVRLSSSACVAFPTCGLAMAESERYLPLLIDKVEKICEEAGVRNDDLVMRMTGCPNGCARPWAAEVAFVGKAPGSYMMMLGGSHDGTRLNKPFIESATEPEILAVLKPMIKRWALERNDGERFGDWTIRAGYIKPTTHGTNFWENGFPTAQQATQAITA
ncbi:sulfite reductase (NADPH) hemoprotein, beta-component [Kwoniella pini CBS 10737]|uniref:assimilatory sulfite reductase (NADPH) n=1 Tax=Kwoniella pini CBS 10737 TaxID=1296096 RepID=A0A1B9I117_9TREE|nr:sulfite reductase (NADPH) hemoprotein, beta-component [Kwoniella pini CBS 10737]OCF49214.1 sulfite reductase (NADPH) hemoprotein, beta-component [Kwoniella pini CBS 10737]